MSKFTPGPWLLDRQTVYTLHRLAHVETNRWSAQVQGYVGCSDEEREANARLIASAPDLLEALQDLFGADMEHVLMGDGKDDQIAAIAKARAAILKATGETA